MYAFVFIYLFISDNFDPVQIADKLKSVADGLYNDVTFKAALNDLKKAAAQEVSYTQKMINIDPSGYVHHNFSHWYFHDI